MESTTRSGRTRRGANREHLGEVKAHNTTRAGLRVGSRDPTNGALRNAQVSGEKRAGTGRLDACSQLVVGVHEEEPPRLQQNDDESTSCTKSTAGAAGGAQPCFPSPTGAHLLRRGATPLVPPASLQGMDLNAGRVNFSVPVEEMFQQDDAAYYGGGPAPPRLLLPSSIRGARERYFPRAPRPAGRQGNFGGRIGLEHGSGFGRAKPAVFEFRGHRALTATMDYCLTCRLPLTKCAVLSGSRVAVGKALTLEATVVHGEARDRGHQARRLRELLDGAY